MAALKAQKDKLAAERQAIHKAVELAEQRRHSLVKALALEESRRKVAERARLEEESLVRSARTARIAEEERAKLAKAKVVSLNARTVALQKAQTQAKKLRKQQQDPQPTKQQVTPAGHEALGPLGLGAALPRPLGPPAA